MDEPKKKFDIVVESHDRVVVLVRTPDCGVSWSLTPGEMKEFILGLGAGLKAMRKIGGPPPLLRPAYPPIGHA